MDKIRIITLNTILLVLAVFLLTGIFIKEKKYKKDERFTFRSNVVLSDSLTGLWLYECNLISNLEEIDIVNRENWRKICVKDASSYEYMYSDSEENTIIPDSISFNWFSFKEEKFYHLKDALPNKKIIEWLNKNQIEDVMFNFKFDINGKITLMIEDNLNESKKLYLPKIYKSKVIKNHTWNDRTNREEDIALINHIYYTPCYIHMQNPQPLKYVKLDAELKLYTLRNYFSEPDKDGKMNIDSELNDGIPESVRIEIKDSINDKSKSFFIDFDIPRNETSTIIRKNPKSEFELHINMNELDSIQEIYLKDSKQKIFLSKPKINYHLQEYMID